MPDHIEEHLREINVGEGAPGYFPSMEEVKQAQPLDIGAAMQRLADIEKGGVKGLFGEPEPSKFSPLAPGGDIVADYSHQLTPGYADDLDFLTEKYGARIPVQALVRYDADAIHDMAMLANWDPDLAYQLWTMGQQEALLLEHRRQVEEEVQRRIDSQKSSRKVEGLLRFFVGDVLLPGTGLVMDAVDPVPEGVSEEEMASIREGVIDEWITGTDGEWEPDVSRTAELISQATFGAFEKAAPALGAGLKFIDDQLAPIADFMIQTPYEPGFVEYSGEPKGPGSYLEAQARQEQQALIDSLNQDFYAKGEEGIKQRILFRGAEATWRDLPETDPEVFQDFMELGQGDEVRAFSIFSSSLIGQEEFEDQLQGIKDAAEKHHEDMVADLESQDMHFTGGLMDSLSWYGDIVLEWAAVTFAAVTDEDARDAFLNADIPEGLKLANEYAASRGNTPSGVLGIEGTAMGLMADLGAGIVFDIPGWLIGPAGKAGAGVRTGAQVERLAKSSLFLRQVDDVIRTGLNRTASSFNHLVAWLPVDDQAKIWNLLGGLRGKNNVARTYLDAGFPAQEISVQGAKSLLDDVQRGALDALDTARLEKSLLRSGQKKPIQFVFDPEKGTFFLEDGVKRLKALDEMGETSVGATVRVGKGPAKGGVVPETFSVPSPEAGRLIGDDLFVLPKSILDDATRLGMSTEDIARVREIMTRAVYSGRMPSGAATTWLANLAGRTVRSALEKGSRPAKALERLVGPGQATTNVPLAVGKSQAIADNILFLSRGDEAWAAKWLDRLYEIEGKYGSSVDDLARATAEVQTYQEKLVQLADELGHLPADDATKAAKTAARSRLINRMREALKTRRALEGTIDARHSDLFFMLQDMENDFAKTNIAWALDEKGNVQWEKINRAARSYRGDAPGITTEQARRFVPEDRINLAGTPFAPDATPEMIRSIERFSNVLNSPQTFHFSATPLDMAIAASPSGRQYAKALSSSKLLSGASSAMRNAYSLWVMDHIWRPATFAVMSFDELSFAAHHFGISGVGKYLQHHSDAMRARLAYLKAGRPDRGASSMVNAGRKYLTGAPAERLQWYDNFLTEQAVALREADQVAGLGWRDIPVNTNEGLIAARRWSGTFLNDGGFQAYFVGPENFTEWYNSSAGAGLRQRAVVMEPGGPRAFKDAAEAYQYFDNAWNWLIEAPAKQAGADIVAVRNAWSKGAANAAKGVSTDLPDDVLKALGTVRGADQIPKSPFQGAMTKINDVVLGNLVESPASFRRSFFAQMAFEQEKKRLYTLGASQPGVRIMEPEEAALYLQSKGFVPPGDLRTSSQMQTAFGSLDELAARHGVWTPSYIDNLAMEKAAQETQRLTYTWEMGSPLSARGRYVFPFGKPWADMWGRWGRELFARPTLRPSLQNFGPVSTAAQAALDMLPFNPKTFGLLSRLAATDFEIDRGWGPIPTDEPSGLFPGSTSTDLGRLFFLPVGGDNPLATIIPGMGPIPLSALDQIVNLAHNPDQDPEGFNQAVDSISHLLPFYNINGAALDLPTRLVGGGNFQFFFESLTQLLPMWAGKENMSEMDLQTALETSRTLQLMTAEDEFWAGIDELRGQMDPGEAKFTDQAIMTHLDSYIKESMTHAAATRLLEKFASWAVPARFDYSDGTEEFYKIWYSAAEDHDFLRPNGVLLDEENLRNNPEALERYGNSVRDIYFKLPDWQQDLVQWTTPGLGANTSARWTWKDKDEPYRTVPFDMELQEALARHSVNVGQRKVRLVTPDTQLMDTIWARELAGTNLAHELFVDTVSTLNEFVWDSVVTEEDKERIGLAYNENLDWAKKFGITSPYRMWVVWNSVKDEIMFAEGLEENDPELIKEMYRQLGISGPPRAGQKRKDPAEMLNDVLNLDVDPFSERWTNNLDDFNDKLLSQSFGGEPTFSYVPREGPPRAGQKQNPNKFTATIPYSEKSQAIAEALGIPLVEMNGEQFVSEIRTWLAKHQDAFYDFVSGQVRPRRDARSGASAAAADAWSQLKSNPYLDDRFLVVLNQIDRQHEETMYQLDKYGGQILPSEQTAFLEKYKQVANLIQSDRDLQQQVNMREIWNGRFASMYGPFDWEPTEPAPLYENGKISPNAYRPNIVKIVDGDTIQVKGPGLTLWDTLRVPNTGLPLHNVRLLGLLAPEYFEGEPAMEAKVALQEALFRAEEEGLDIYLVRDPEYTGDMVDPFGRELAWLYIGDEPYYDPENGQRRGG